MKKEQLKKLYIESKKSEDNEDFIRIIKKQLQDVLGSFGFDVDCVGNVVKSGGKRKKLLVNTTTVLLRRGRELYMTQRINALIDLIFSTDPDEKTLFDIIYNRI
jgi:hypothetical protein